MNTEEKRNHIEENYINGNITDAKTGFKKLSVKERKEFLSDKVFTPYQINEVAKNTVRNFTQFLIENL